MISRTDPVIFITASCHAEGREGGPANWEIDEKQEQLIVQCTHRVSDTL